MFLLFMILFFVSLVLDNRLVSLIPLKVFQIIDFTTSDKSVPLNMSFEAIVSFGWLILAIVIIYLIYSYIESFGTISAKYCATRADIGDPGGPTCRPGAVEFEGICYVDKWTQYGGVKTAPLTVEYPGDSALFTNCGGEIQALNQGDTCSNLPDWTRGPGWFKTAVCTCQHGGIVTAAQYGIEDVEPYPTHCPPDADFYGGICYKEKCPNGTYRSYVCTCTPN